MDIDEVAPSYGAEVGWSVEHLIQRNSEIGWLASESEWEPVRAHIVERTLEDHPEAVARSAQ